MSLTLSKILLGPILLAQGLYIRKTIVRLPEPGGARSGVCGVGPRYRIAVLGDSAAAGVGAEHQDQALLGQLVNHLSKRFEVHWRLIAKSGETTATFLESLQQHEPVALDLVLVSLGVNDSTSRVSAQAYASQTRDLIKTIREKFSQPRIIFSGLPPMGRFPALPNPLRWYLGKRSDLLDNTLEHLAPQLRCEYIKAYANADQSFVAADGFHPGPKAYQAWASRVAEHVLDVPGEQVTQVT